MSTLTDDEALADQTYSFPAGTMEALGATESSQGTNLGAIGNVFQVLPSTAADPGYGLTSVDGNSAMSTGAYLSALEEGPANGDLSTALAMYQGGAANPTPYGANTPVAQFLAAQTSGGASGDIYQLNGDTMTATGVSALPSAAASAVGSAATAAASALAGPAMRIAFVVVAVLFLAIGLIALALHNGDVQKAVKTAAFM